MLSHVGYGGAMTGDGTRRMAAAVESDFEDELWLTVGEVARHAGLSVRTLHHYDQLGLLHPSQRSDGGYRLYSPGDLARLLQIQHLKSLGLNLDEVGAALDVDDFDATGVLEDHIAAVERRITDEQRLLNTLHALRKPARTGWREVLSAVEQAERLRHPEPHVRFRAALGSSDGVPLEDLVRQLVADPVSGVREALTWAIAQHGPTAIPTLIPLLEHPEAVVRAQAAHTLSKFGDPMAVPAVLPLLGDGDAVVAAKAAQVLGRLGGPDAVQSLVDRVGTGPRELDDAVIAALEEIGRDAVGQLLTKLVAVSSRTRAGAAEALGLIGDPVAVAALSPLLTDPEAAVRFEVIVALGQLDGEEAAEAVVQAEQSPDDRVAQIARRLSNRRATPSSG